MDDQRVSRHARDVLAEIACQGADEEFLLLCHFFSDDNDLERACWMLAHTLDPSVDIESFEHRVNQWGRQFLVRISGSGRATGNARKPSPISWPMNCAFAGIPTTTTASGIRCLPHVIETRMGIPITLAILYRMVAGRAGMKVDGINLPGHFIARHGEVLFDPFHKGRILTKADCEEILTRQSLRLRASHLEAGHPAANSFAGAGKSSLRLRLAEGLR